MIQELLALPDTVQHRRFAKAMQYQARLKISENEPFFQALRRALNRLHEPSIRSVGMINASWGGARWHLAANIVVSAPPGVDMFRAFNHAKNVIALDIQPVANGAAEILKIFREAHSAECVAESAIDRTTVPLNKLRREYYSWLSEIKAGGRIFRYGCDRYFFSLAKSRTLRLVLGQLGPWRVQRKQYPPACGTDCFPAHRFTCFYAGRLLQISRLAGLVPAIT